MGKFNFKAVALGVLTDIIATIIITFVIVIIFGEIPGPLFFDLVIGLFCVILGGYVTAKFTSNDKLFNASLVGVVGILIGLPFLGLAPLWYDAISVLFVIPAAYAGGILETYI